MKVAIVSTILPNCYNNGGVPSGLLWQIMNTLSYEVEYMRYFKISNAANKYIESINSYGVYFNKLKIDMDAYDLIFVYPDNLFFSIPEKYWDKTIVIGPDSPSLRDYRVYRNSRKFFHKSLKYFFAKKCEYNERVIAKKAKGYLVVGLTDQFWIRNHSLKNLSPNEKNKIIFLRHPIFQKTMVGELDKYVSNAKKRFVFANIPYLYNESFFDSFLTKIQSWSNKNKISFLIVGKKSKWLYDAFKVSGIKDIEYIPWVDDYKEICQVGRDVHCIPLMTGAGMKNRTLTALINNLEIICTPIAYENIIRSCKVGVYITRKPYEFADLIEKINDNTFGHNLYCKMICERKELAKNTMTQYKKTIQSLLKV